MLWLPRPRPVVTQVAVRWWPEDGDAAALAAFCEANFLTDPGDLAATFRRLETVLEQVDGHLHEVRRELTTPLDLDTGPITTVDRLFADLDLAAHVEEDQDDQVRRPLLPNATAHLRRQPR